ncbi:hypothetical protein ABMA28_003745 [Loxostege sticticalis]|uniref:Peptidase S1 domain-containing protein n=1 Tax=Loxostege sticticalis TaxID=481309 RepID=A0ABD0SSW8_LOXSC
MKWYLLVCVAVVAVTVEASPVEGPKWSGYHESVGIPMAARLKKLEHEAMSGRIVGGTPVSLGTHPFMVGIVIHLFSPGTSMCGASLLTNTRSLTAAHCWYDGWLQVHYFTMVFGSRTLHTGGVRIDTTDVEMHPNWNLDNLNNDIAIVRHAFVSYNNNISPIRLPTGQQTNNFSQYISDSFPTFNPDQREARLQVISNEQCAGMYGDSIVIHSTLCTLAPRGINVCLGDSGGPLATGAGSNRMLIGVTSFVAPECEAGDPSGFARVTSFLPWIMSRL